jgi:hypothetical protein
MTRDHSARPEHASAGPVLQLGTARGHQSRSPRSDRGAAAGDIARDIHVYQHRGVVGG